MLVRARIAVVVAAACLAATACSEKPTPTAPPGPAASTAAGPNNPKVHITRMTLSSNVLNIDGPAVDGYVHFGNSGSALDNVWLRGEIVQGTTTREATRFAAACPNPPGLLPSGGCDMNFTAAASNDSTGSGTLAPDSALFILHIVQIIGNVETELATRTLNITLVGSPRISALSLTSDTLPIGGPGTTYTATIDNPAGTLQNVLLQGWINQGATRRAANGFSVSCGAATGLLPPGTCTVSYTTAASNAASGTGTLVPDTATFELDLVQSSGGTQTVYDVHTLGVVLIANKPQMTSAKLGSAEMAIEGPAITDTVTFKNPTGLTASGLRLESWVVQDTARRKAGGTTLQCGSGDGILPPGTCSMLGTAAASDTASGTGTLVPGPATVEFDLIQNTGSGDVIVDTAFADVNLVAGTPKISSFDPTSTFVVIGGTATPYTATIDNPGAPLDTVLLQGWVSQDTARRAAGGGQVTCGGPVGYLPTGSCTEGGEIVASNTDAGSGTLVPGPATFVLQLKQSNAIVFDSTTAGITLVANTPSIVGVSFQLPAPITIGTSPTYNATLYNPLSTTLDTAFVQAYFIQNNTLVPAGGTSASCPTTYVMAPGPCSVTFHANASAGLSPGIATFELQFYNGGTLLDTKTIEVELVSPSSQ